MKVILLTDVQKLGRKYDVKEVSSGYAQNFLIRGGLAELATKSKLTSLELLKKKEEGAREVHNDLLRKNFESLKDTKITVTGKANDKGHLFKAIHEDEILAALKTQAHIELDSSMLKLKEVIKSTGDHNVQVEFGKDKVIFKLAVDPE